MKAQSSALAERHAVEVMVSPKLIASARSFASAAKSERTRHEYRRDWRIFRKWCEAHGLSALPASAQTVALFLTARIGDGRKVSTVTRSLAAIAQAHKATGAASPRGEAAVQEVIKGIRRPVGVAQVQKAPLLPRDLRAIVEELPSGLLGLRDRALLLLGFAGAFRRSELVALEVADLVFSDAGLEITIRRSKTDQEGRGRKVGVPFGRKAETCPVRSTRSWLDAASIESGPIFREVNRHGRFGTKALSGRSVARIVKRSAEAAGLDPTNFAGHSLRAGLVTSAAKAGRSLHSIAKQTGHKSLAMIERYIRDADLFEGNAAEDLL